MATESQYFKQQRKANLNPLVNGKAQWQRDEKLDNERATVFERVAYDLNSGIL